MTRSLNIRNSQAVIAAILIATSKEGMAQLTEQMLDGHEPRHVGEHFWCHRLKFNQCHHPLGISSIITDAQVAVTFVLCVLVPAVFTVVFSPGGRVGFLAVGWEDRKNKGWFKWALVMFFFSPLLLSSRL